MSTPGDDLEGLELAVRELPERVAPLTGELVDLRNAPEVAGALLSLRETVAALQDWRGLLEAVLRLESQRQGTKTLRLGEVEVVISGGEAPRFDAEALERALEEAGMPRERIAEIVVTTVTRRVNANKAKAAESANPAYGALIAAHRRREPVPWRVEVKRA